MAFNVILILLDKLSKSWSNTISLLLELLPCSEIATLHHDILILGLVYTHELVVIDFLFKRHKVVLVEFVKIVATEDITAERQRLL